MLEENWRGRGARNRPLRALSMPVAAWRARTLHAVVHAFLENRIAYADEVPVRRGA